MQIVKSQFNNEIEWHTLLKSGDRVFIGSHAAVPNALIESLINEGKGINDLELTHIATLGDSKWALPEYKNRFKVNTFFIQVRHRCYCTCGVMGARGYHGGTWV